MSEYVSNGHTLLVRNKNIDNALGDASAELLKRQNYYNGAASKDESFVMSIEISWKPPHEN